MDDFAGRFKALLTNADAVIVPMGNCPGGVSAWVEPVAGDTVNVWFSRDGGMTFYEWLNGGVTSTSINDIKYTVLNSGITHMKVQRTAGSGTTSTYGVC